MPKKKSKPIKRLVKKSEDPCDCCARILAGLETIRIKVSALELQLRQERSVLLFPPTSPQRDYPVMPSPWTPPPVIFCGKTDHQPAML